MSVLSLMSSRCVKDLDKVAKRMTENGFDWSAKVCRHASKRMARMESLIVDLYLVDKFEDVILKEQGSVQYVSATDGDRH